jgi:hypothetical protein
VRPIASARRIAALLLLGGGTALAQSTLPAISPTSLPTTPPQSTPASPPAAPTQPPPLHAQVIFAHGQLEITADNSSLNQILRDIGTQTGMKITGGVADERVFGKYGPAPPAQVLASLIDGTGSNMLLRDTASNVPAELILTPQGGGPTPPNPNARDFDDDTPEQPEPPVRTQQERPRPAYVPPMPPPAPVATIPDAASQPSPPSAGANPASPNSAQTPQQIYEQLQRLQQSQPQPANPR